MFKGVRHYPDFILLMCARFIFLAAPASISLFVKPLLENNNLRFVAHAVATASKPCRDANNLVLATPLGQPCLDNTGNLIFEAGGLLSLILGLVLVAAISASYPAATLADKFGRKKVLYALSAIGMVGGLLLLLPTFIMHNAVADSMGMTLAAQEAYLDTIRPSAIIMTVIFGAMLGISWGGFLGVDWAFATDLIPLSEAGRFMGLSNLATAGCQAFAAFVGGFLVDSLLGFTGLFILVGLYYIVSILILMQVHEPTKASVKLS
jgi:MFS family permease